MFSFSALFSLCRQRLTPFYLLFRFIQSCKMMVALISSTSALFRLAVFFTPASIIVFCAMTDVKRSS